MTGFWKYRGRARVRVLEVKRDERQDAVQVVFETVTEGGRILHVRVEWQNNMPVIISRCLPDIDRYEGQSLFIPSLEFIQICRQAATIFSQKSSAVKQLTLELK